MPTVPYFQDRKKPKKPAIDDMKTVHFLNNAEQAYYTFQRWHIHSGYCSDAMMSEVYRTGNMGQLNDILYFLARH